LDQNSTWINSNGLPFIVTTPVTSVTLTFEPQPIIIEIKQAKPIKAIGARFVFREPWPMIESQRILGCI
jgi:hypothetical protein